MYNRLVLSRRGSLKDSNSLPVAVSLSVGGTTVDGQHHAARYDTIKILCPAPEAIKG